MINNISTGSKPLKAISFFSQLSPKTKELFERIKKKKNIDPEKLICKKGDNKTIFNFNKFKTSVEITSDIYYDKNLLKDVKNNQPDMLVLLRQLKNTIQQTQKK